MGAVCEKCRGFVPLSAPQEWTVLLSYVLYVRYVSLLVLLVACLVLDAVFKWKLKYWFGTQCGQFRGHPLTSRARERCKKYLLHFIVDSSSLLLVFEPSLLVVAAGKQKGRRKKKRKNKA